MFEKADDFFKGLGLLGLDEATIDFYGRSMLEKPKDGREVVCHPSAWDFRATNKLPGDFRIKMCTQITMNDLITVHHEMGHIQYYAQYAGLEISFRSDADSGKLYFLEIVEGKTD
jgi:peptidyl-dipeptidase A